MSFTQTPNYSLYKPTINADNDQWGTHLNLNADTLDSTLAALPTTASVQAAQRYLNYADNSGFSVNQRANASGTALAAAAFGHDRWKGGAGGVTYTFTQSPGPSTTITISAGTLQQVIDGASLAGGSYMLSWTGTAQGRVGAGSYAASPVAVTGIVAGANTTIEFNTGTLGTVKFEPGTVATPWVAQPAREELAKCQRFYQYGSLYLVGYGAAGTAIGSTVALAGAMRSATPTMVFAPSGNNNVGTVTIQAMAGAGQCGQFLFYALATGSVGGTQIQGNFTASADL